MLAGIVLRSFEGRAPFGPESLKFIETMHQAYQLDIVAADSHQMIENDNT